MAKTLKESKTGRTLAAKFSEEEVLILTKIGVATGLKIDECLKMAVKLGGRMLEALEQQTTQPASDIVDSTGRPLG